VITAHAGFRLSASVRAIVVVGLTVDEADVMSTLGRGGAALGRYDKARNGPSSHSACGQPRDPCGRHNATKFFLRTPGGRCSAW
jgi:hypothetical protein